jgi:hypothetical protein
MARLTLTEIHPHRGPNRHSYQPDGVPHTETQPPSRPHRPQQPDRTPHPAGDPPSPRAHPSPSTRRRRTSSRRRSHRAAGHTGTGTRSPTARIIPPEIQPTAGHTGTGSTARPLNGTPHPAGDPPSPRTQPALSPARRHAASRRRSKHPAGHTGTRTSPTAPHPPRFRTTPSGVLKSASSPYEIRESGVVALSL